MSEKRITWNDIIDAWQRELDEEPDDSERVDYVLTINGVEQARWRGLPLRSSESMVSQQETPAQVTESESIDKHASK